MELKIYNPTAENTIKAIDWNFEELKQEITARADDYKSLVYTDDNIKEAKADRASLNKFIKVLQDKRKEVKKMMLEPYTQFENQVKDLVAIIDEANLNIDSQVKAFDMKKRDEKFEKVKEIYEKTFSIEGAEQLKTIITFEKAFKESYLNVSTTQKTIINEMEDLRDRVTYDLGIINADTGEYQFEMKEAYLKNFSMTEALAVKQQFEENARRKAKYEAQRKADEEKRIAEEKAKAERVAKAGVAPSNKSADKAQKISTPSNTQKVTIAFKVVGTVEQIDELKKYLVDNKIKYGPVEQ